MKTVNVIEAIFFDALEKQRLSERATTPTRREAQTGA